MVFLENVGALSADNFDIGHLQPRSISAHFSAKDTILLRTNLWTKLIRVEFFE